MAKAKGLLIVAALGAIGLGAVMAQKKGDVVTAASGKTWRVVMLGNDNGMKSYELFAPAGSFGPHAELSVLRYTQDAAGTRKIIGVGSGVPELMVKTAASDFGLPFNSSLMPTG